MESPIRPLWPQEAGCCKIWADFSLSQLPVYWGLRLTGTNTEADTQEDLCLSVPNSPPGKGHTEGVCPDACLSQRFPKPGLEEGFYRSCRRILCPVSLGNTIYYILWGRWASLVVQMVMNLPAMQETRVWSLVQEDPLEKEMATDSSILIWRIPWPGEPGELQSKGSQRVGHDWATNTLGTFNACESRSYTVRCSIENKMFDFAYLIFYQGTLFLFSCCLSPFLSSSFPLFLPHTFS